MILLNTLRLSVASFDKRAILVYERAGFAPVRTFDHKTNGGVRPFLEMTRPVSGTSETARV